uniref:Uncharacterized protein n=1 Tax=Knipowitschia caucasica TaxID=637954 RepID=A0AAV2K7Z6_KNICA
MVPTHVQPGATSGPLDRGPHPDRKTVGHIRTARPWATSGPQDRGPHPDRKTVGHIRTARPAKPVQSRISRGPRTCQMYQDVLQKPRGTTAALVASADVPESETSVSLAARQLPPALPQRRRRLMERA